MSTSRSILKLWLSRLLIFLMGSVLLIGLVYLQEGMVPVYAEQTREEIARGLAPKQIGAYFSAEKYRAELVKYLADLRDGELYLYNETGTAHLTWSWLRPGERVKFLPLMAESWFTSFKLFGFAISIGLVVGILFGSLVAVKNRFLRAGALGFSILGLSLPDFLVILVGQFITVWASLRYGTQLFPILADPGSVRGMFLATTVLALAPAGYITRLVASSLDEIMKEEYIRTARGKGLPEGRVILEHAFRNAVPRVISGLPAALNITLSGLIVVEQLTVYPGLTKWLLQGQGLSIATSGLCFIAWFLLFDGVANTLRILVNPLQQGVTL